jgi:hypothetical protein
MIIRITRRGLNRQATAPGFHRGTRYRPKGP